MSTYYYLFCKDCRVKMAFVNQGGLLLVGAKEGMPQFIKEHYACDVEVLSEHRDILYQPDVVDLARTSNAD